MIDFNCTCAICHKLIGKKDKERYQHEVDDIKLCYNHFRMMLRAGLLFEGADDDWHFINCEDIKLL